MLGPFVDFVLEFSGVTTKINKVMASMHTKQLAFFNDPKKAKVLLGGRQGGKTWGTSLWLVGDWEAHPGQTAVYITKEASAAERRAWPQIKKICQDFKLPVKFNNSNLTATFPNGYTVLCTGCKDKNAADRIRGEAFGFIKIMIDEPATFDSDLLEYLCTEVAAWTLLQTGGDLLLCGTPGPIPDAKDFWYGICHSAKWSKHTFTVYDNPFIGDADEIVKDYLDRFGFTLQSPRVRREVFAEWVLDTDGLIYINSLEDFTSENGYHDLPMSKPFDVITLGVDLGFSPDPCAFSVVGSWNDKEEVYLIESYSKEKLTTDLIAAEIRKLRKQHSVHRTIVDAGGGGLTTAMTLNSYGVYVEKTPKGVKRPKIDLLRGAINSRRLKVQLIKAAEFVSEVKTVVWNEDQSSHQEGYSDHNIDATIQALIPHRQFAWLADKEEKKEKLDPVAQAKLDAFLEAANNS
jgi:hypothetical protein